MAFPLNNFNFPKFPPPPPSRPTPPPPQSPPSSPEGDTTVIVIVSVSFGCVFFLVFLVIALFCFVKRGKKNKEKKVQETEIIHFDEYKKIKENIVQGPYGAQAMVVSIDDDVHVEEEIQKNEQLGENMHEKSAIMTPPEEAPQSFSYSSHQQMEHKL